MPDEPVNVIVDSPLRNTVKALKEGQYACFQIAWDDDDFVAVVGNDESPYRDETNTLFWDTILLIVCFGLTNIPDSDQCNITLPSLLLAWALAKNNAIR